MLPPRKRFVTPPHPEGRLQRHIKTPNFAAGPAQSRWESAFPRPFAACGCVSDAYTTHCPLLWGHVHTLSMFFSKNLRKIFHFSGFSRCFPHLSRRGFQVFSCFLSFSPFFSRFLAFQKSRAKRRARGRRARAREAEIPANCLRTGPHRAKDRAARVPVRRKCRWNCLRTRLHRAKGRAARRAPEAEAPARQAQAVSRRGPPRAPESSPFRASR